MAANDYIKNSITADEVRNLIDYDPETGEFRWKKFRGGMLAGSKAGHLQSFGGGVTHYYVIRIGKLFLAHRLAWLIVTGKFPCRVLDHINGCSTDNRFANLREASISQNMQNKRKPAHNKSGFKGVSRDLVNDKWVARIRVPGGKYLNLGRFVDVQDAHKAYCSASKELYGEFARAE